MRFSGTLLAMTAALSLSACGPNANEGEAGRAGATVISSGAAQIGGPFTLVDETGSALCNETKHLLKTLERPLDGYLCNPHSQ